MAGGLQSSVGQGTFGRPRSIALAGSGVTVWPGVVNSSVHGGQVIYSYLYSLPGLSNAFEAAVSSTPAGIASTVGQGTLGLGNKQQELTTSVSGGGQTFVQCATGTLSAQGLPVTVNISGYEAVFSQGNVDSGGQPLTGQSVSVATGTITRPFEIAITGLQSSVAVGNISVSQDADDTRINSSSGVSVANIAVLAVGLESISASGTITFAGDFGVDLTGEESTLAAGDIGIEEAYPIAGEQINSAQESIGAPGFASLTGSSVSVDQGTVYLDNDRTYPIVGQAMTISDGQAVTSYLAFVTGQVLNVEQQGLGPRNVELVGIEISVQQGTLTAPTKQRKEGGFAAKPAVRKRRTFVTIDGEDFVVESEEEAEELLNATRELSEQQARKAAEAVVQRRIAIAKASDSKIDVSPINLERPWITSDDQGLTDKLKAIVVQAYTRAEIEAELAVKRSLEDDEEALLLLLMNE